MSTSLQKHLFLMKGGATLLWEKTVRIIAHTSRLPLNTLEGIWNEASESLKKEGVIIIASAPGFENDAEFVIAGRSHS